MTTLTSRYTRTQLIRSAAAIGALVVASTACGSDEAAAPATTVVSQASVAPGAGGSLSISGFAFGAVSATAGATVSVKNADGAAHTVTADDGSFDLSVSGGSTGEFAAPTAPGSYPFHCSIHGSMQGTLVVEG